MKSTVVPPQPVHLRMLARSMRKSDLAEVHAMGYLAEEALRISLSRSLVSGTLLLGGEVAAMYGAGVAQDGRCLIPWLLTSDVVEKAPVAFHRVALRAVRQLRAVTPGLPLRALVHAEYTRTLAWLERLGFTFEAPIPVGPKSALFVVATLAPLGST